MDQKPTKDYANQIKRLRAKMGLSCRAPWIVVPHYLLLRYVNAPVGEGSGSLQQPAGPSIRQNPNGPSARSAAR